MRRAVSRLSVFISASFSVVGMASAKFVKVFSQNFHLYSAVAELGSTDNFSGHRHFQFVLAILADTQFSGNTQRYNKIGEQIKKGSNNRYGRDSS